MKKVYDKKGEYKGILRSISELKNNWQSRTLESFVRAGCVIYEYDVEKYGAIPGINANIVEVEE